MYHFHSIKCCLYRISLQLILKQFVLFAFDLKFVVDGKEYFSKQQKIVLKDPKKTISSNFELLSEKVAKKVTSEEQEVTKNTFSGIIA